MSAMERRAGLFASVAFAAITLASALTLAFQRGRSIDDSVVNVAIWALSIACAILLANAAAGAWALRAARRAARLTVQFPDAVVIESGRLGGLHKFLVPEGSIDPVQYVAVTFDRAGMTFWRDYSPPRIWRHVEVGSGRAISVEQFTSSNRVRLRFRISTQDDDILVPVLGRGLVRLMSPSHEIVDEVADEVAALTGWDPA
jgi:hypothetical protein